MKKIVSISLVSMLISSFSFAQKLTFHIKGQKDTTVNLIRYFGNKLYLADTAEMKNGTVTFDGSKQKAGVLGVYWKPSCFEQMVKHKF